jgi:hypothetical protein
MSPGAPSLSCAGFIARNSVDMSLHNVRIRGQAGPAYSMRGCRGLRHSFCDPEQPFVIEG